MWVLGIHGQISSRSRARKGGQRHPGLTGYNIPAMVGRWGLSYSTMACISCVHGGEWVVVHAREAKAPRIVIEPGGQDAVMETERESVLKRSVSSVRFATVL